MFSFRVFQPCVYVCAHRLIGVVFVSFFCCPFCCCCS